MHTSGRVQVKRGTAHATCGQLGQPHGAGGEGADSLTGQALHLPLHHAHCFHVAATPPLSTGTHMHTLECNTRACCSNGCRTFWLNVSLIFRSASSARFSSRSLAVCSMAVGGRVGGCGAACQANRATEGCNVCVCTEREHWLGWHTSPGGACKGKGAGGWVLCCGGASWIRNRRRPAAQHMAAQHAQLVGRLVCLVCAAACTAHPPLMASSALFSTPLVTASRVAARSWALRLRGGRARAWNGGEWVGGWVGRGGLCVSGWWGLVQVGTGRWYQLALA